MMQLFFVVLPIVVGSIMVWTATRLHARDIDQLLTELKYFSKMKPSSLSEALLLFGIIEKFLADNPSLEKQFRKYILEQT